MKERMIEIIKMADTLGWITPGDTSYPLMQLSEVEKCMDAMTDDFQLERMREWCKDFPQKTESVNRVNISNVL